MGGGERRCRGLGEVRGEVWGSAGGGERCGEVKREL